MTEDFEIYPSEYAAIEKAGLRLQREFINTPLTSSAQRYFEQAAGNLFGEAGFEVRVEWQELADTENNNPLGLNVPKIHFVGRVKKESEVDHDRLAHDIVTGKADGVAGYIREDGKLHEEPRKKLIL